MKIYRIIELMHRSGEEKIEFVIERRKGTILKSWKEVFNIEDGSHKRIPHHTYEDAELYLLENYTKQGIGSLVTRSGNVYYVERYNYHTM
jgi:hypothetical protein